MTQEQKVLIHLKELGTITSWDAILEYGITRLSAKIYNLRKLGYNISIDYKTTLNRFGEKVTFGEYKLEDSYDK